jgi:hypothetical protein
VWFLRGKVGGVCFSRGEDHFVDANKMVNLVKDAGKELGIKLFSTFEFRFLKME